MMFSVRFKPGMLTAELNFYCICIMFFSIHVGLSTAMHVQKTQTDSVQGLLSLSCMKHYLSYQQSSNIVCTEVFTDTAHL